MLRLLTSKFLAKHPLDATRALESHTPQQLADMLTGVDPKIVALAARYLPVPKLVATLSEMVPDKAARLYAELPLDVQLVLWLSLSEELTTVLKSALPVKQIKLIERLTRFPAGSAASLMDPAVFTIPDDIHVGEALTMANHHANALRFYVYVSDRENHLVGVLTLRQLMKAPADASVASLMERRVSTIRASASRSDVLECPDWQRLHSLPVVDDDGVLIGVIRYETWRRELARTTTNTGEPVWDTLVALGELYWSGMSDTLLGTATDKRSTDREKRNGG